MATMCKSGIYKITNTKNNCVYIGQTKDFSRRKTAHFSLLKKNKHTNKFLQNDYNEYGEKNFIFEKIQEEQDREKRLELEQYFINQYSNVCYNNMFYLEQNNTNTESKIEYYKTIIHVQEVKIERLETEINFWKEKIELLEKGYKDIIKTKDESIEQLLKRFKETLEERNRELLGFYKKSLTSM